MSNDQSEIVLIPALPKQSDRFETVNPADPRKKG
jgi:hypothetical protein